MGIQENADGTKERERGREMYYNAVLKKLSNLGNRKTGLLNNGIGAVAYGASDDGIAAGFDGFVHR